MGRGARKGAGGVALRGDDSLRELRRRVASTRDWGSVLDDRSSAAPIEEMSPGEKLFLRHQLLLEAYENDIDMFESLPLEYFPEGLNHSSGPSGILRSFLGQAFRLPQSDYNEKILAEMFPENVRQEILESVSKDPLLVSRNAMQLALVLSMLSSEKEQRAAEEFLGSQWTEMQTSATVGGRVPEYKPLLVDPQKVWVPGQGHWSGACVDISNLPGSSQLTLLVEDSDKGRLRKVGIHELIHQVQELGLESSNEWTEAVTEGLALLRSRDADTPYAYRYLVAPLYLAIEESGGDLHNVLEELNLRTEPEGREWLREEFGKDVGQLFEHWLEEGEDSGEIIEEAILAEIAKNGEGGIRTRETL